VALLALLVDFAHLLAAGVWVGGLLYLSLTLWLGHQLPAESRLWLYEGLIINFSTLAAGAVGVLLLSGGYLAWQHVGSWTLLFGTAYGLTLLAKIGLALPAFGIAAVNLLFIKPRFRSATEVENEVSQNLPRRFTQLVQGETLFVLLVLVAAGYLTDLQRGQDAPLLVDESGKVLLFDATVDDLSIILSLEPALVGQNQFEVYLQDAAGQPVDNASQVSLHFTFLGQSMGTATAEMTPTGEGRYTTAGGYISLIGPWQVEVSIRRPNTFDAFAPFRMEAGLGGTIRPIGSETLLERLTKFLSQSGGSVTGVLLMGLGLGWVFLAKRAAKRDWQLVPLLLPGFVALGLGIGQLYIFYDEFTPAKFTTNPILPDSSSIARGKQLYETNCAMCHGVEGQGDGELAANFFPPPVNFTAGHTTTHPDGDVYFWIKEGIEGSAMPAFGKQLSDEEVWHLVNYVRRLSAQQ
jgi:copper transport protein